MSHVRPGHDDQPARSAGHQALRRVLMVSPHFPPDTSAGTHRVRLLAPHLPATGWEPTVVTVDPSAYEGALDPDLAALVPATVRVVRAPALPADTTRRLGLGDLGIRSWFGLKQACDRLLATETFDALFITIYPTYPALLGPILKRRYRLPFVLDYQDPWVGAWGRDVGGGVGGTPDFKSRMTRALAARCEPYVVKAADGLTAVSSRTYQDVLQRVPQARPRTCAEIPIGFDAADINHLRSAPRPNTWFPADDGRVHLCYVGTLLPTGFEVLRAFFGGLALLRDRDGASADRIRLHFFGTSNQRDPKSPERVMPVAREMGVAQFVTEHPPRLDYLDALSVQTHADGLLLLGSIEPHYTASKIFPALLSGRPMIALYHSASTVVQMLAGRESATVMAFGPEDPSARVPQVADALARCARAPRAMPFGAAAPADEACIEAWSARVLAGTLGRVLDEVARRADGERDAA
jgi:hypothetical protein